MNQALQAFFEEGLRGEHICSIHKNKEERFNTITGFFQAGLARHERCVLILDGVSEGEVILEFGKREVDMRAAFASKQFLLLTPRQTYLLEDRFDPDKTLTYLSEVEQQAHADGYSGLRICGEAGWALKRPGDCEKLATYEAQITKVLPTSTITALCLYDETLFPEKALLDAIHEHPVVIMYETPTENLYFSQETAQPGHELPPDSYSLIRDDFLKGS